MRHGESMDNLTFLTIPVLSIEVERGFNGYSIMLIREKSATAQRKGKASPYYIE
jgi:hypothetical protein